MGDAILADGFREDCLELITSFVAQKSFDFQIFCEEYKRKNFNCIYVGHTFYYELIQYAENCFLILKSLFLTLQTLNERIGGLFLMYAMYFKQPTKDFCKFRFTLNEWNDMKVFYDQINVGTDFIQARMIFWRLWQENAFRFVECDIESIQSKSSCVVKRNNFRKIGPIIRKDIKMLGDETEGVLGAIDLLQVGYNEMKESLSNTIDDCSGMATTNILQEIFPQLDKIEKFFKEETPYKRQKKHHKVTNRKGKIMPSTDQTCSDVSVSNSDDGNFSGNDFVENNSSTDSDMECLNIGSKRFYLKRKAMHKAEQSLHFIEPQPSSSSGCTLPKVTSTELEENTVAKIAPNKKKIELNKESGNIIIINQAKRYKRNPKSSLVKKQFADCPAEASAEIDGPPRKLRKRKAFK